MAWIESHQELARHPKTKKLARLLGTSTPAAIGHLHMFWWWAMDFAQDGNIAHFDPEDIADAVEWSITESHIFIDSMIKSGFLDECPEGLLIHDWHDYVGRLLEKKNANKERMRKARAAIVQSTCNAQQEHVQGLPNLTLPNQTKPNNTKPTGQENIPPVSPQEEQQPESSKHSRNQKKDTEQEKIQYADYVFLSPIEYQKLTEQLGEGERERYFLEFAAWISGKPKREQQSRSAYLTILNWHRRDSAKGTGPPQGQLVGTPSRNGRVGYGRPVIPIATAKSGGKRLSDEEMEAIIQMGSSW